MITDEDERHLREIARRGIAHADPNFVVYGQIMLKDIAHYAGLKRPKAKAELEKKIRHAAQQIERNRTPHVES